ncbi:uncharacterized protein M6B38_328145 [Iris pallida]|uniref:Uncharacterized protein n=1 Tax=Iris pallida TaxID=29817 RepID=A0AAX6H7J8_IRIPA|nr:uncharacterized protein M6B38_328145 [Iris pallida]
MSHLNLQILLSPSSPPPPPPPPFHSLKCILFHPSSSLLATKTLKPLALAPLIGLRSARVRVFVQNNGVVKEEEEDDLGEEGDVFRKTLRLVECSMFASVAGLAYFLSNSLAIENYFGCFFSLPIVISSMRWGVAAGRKTMVATAMLLLTLSGPVKASTYLLMHGLVGLTMGSLWKLGTKWSISIALSTVVRALGAIGYVLISSFLIKENILDLITINIHASLTYILMAIGVNTIPSMDAIYTLFGILLLFNCGFFVFLLHILYAVFLSKLGMKDSLTLPGWIKKAI